MKFKKYKLQWLLACLSAILLGCGSGGEKTNIKPIAVINDGANSKRACKSSSILLDGSTSRDSDGSIISYAWMDQNSQIVSTQASFNKSFSSIGTYTYTLTVKDNDDASSSDTIMITVTDCNNPPIAVINGGENNRTICESSIIVFDANSSNDSDGNIISYHWIDQNSQTLSKQMSFDVNFTDTGEYIYTLTTEDDKNSTGSDSFTVLVKNCTTKEDLEKGYFSTKIYHSTGTHRVPPVMILNTLL